MKLLFTSLLATLPLGISSAATLGTPGTGLFLLTGDNNLIAMTDSAPSAFSPPVPLTGVAVGDTLVAIDVRPQNQQLYALGVNTTANTFQLYHVSPESGLVVAVGPAQSLTTDGTTIISAAAARYGIDFNPVTDRLRVVNSSGLNFRMNPSTGGLVDGNNGGGVVTGTNPDGPINGATTSVDEVAYINNDPFTVSTTLYTIDAATNALYFQNPPNNGTQVLLAGVTVAGGPVDFSGVKGFDIAPAGGFAYAALDFFGITALYEINLTTGAATYLSTPAGFSITSLAVRTQIPVAAGLSASGVNLILFRTDSPGTTTTRSVTGVVAGETLVGIDYRPATGQLMGLGVNAAANSGTLYLIEPINGASSTATAIGTPGSIAFTTDGSTQIDLPDPAVVGYGFDFNPAVDRIRVVVGNGLSFRVNPITGAPLDGNAGITGVNPDGAINGATTAVTAAAYTNNFHSVPSGVTTLYTLDDVTNSLFIQNPPNNGTQTNQKQITVNGSPLDFTGVNGFDITADGAMAAASSASSFGYGWAALTVGGTTRLYRIHLSDGKAVLQGQIGSGSVALAGFTLACEPGDGFLPMTWPSVIGTNYRIETSENLVDWQPVPIIAKAAQATSTVSVPYSADTPKCFWRAVAP